MKKPKHQDRKSFRQWGMPGQRMQTQDADKLDARRVKALAAGRNFEAIGRNNGGRPDEPHAQHGTTQFRLHRRSILSRNSNRFNRHPKGEPPLRPHWNDLRESLRSLDRVRRYATGVNGEIRRLN